MPAAPYQASPLFLREGFRHAFFTRRGGVSEGAYDSLNFSATTGDDAANVAENMRRASGALGVDEGRVFFLSQVHGVEAREVTAGDDAKLVRTFSGDVIFSKVPELACAVRTADCVPVLLADRESGFVAAVHAGWRGIVREVVPAAVTALSKAIGGRSALIAAVGPHISVRSFEVSPEVALELSAASPDPNVVEPGPGGKPHVNLRRIVSAQLLALGFEPEDIDHVEGCTVSEPELYFSYRRDGAHSGRLLSAIVATGA